jgi:hypothetical protein
MKFRITKRIGYNTLKGWNTHEYPRWRWHTNHTANAREANQKQDGEIKNISRIEFPQDRTYSPTSAYVHDDDDDDDDDDDRLVAYVSNKDHLGSKIMEFKMEYTCSSKIHTEVLL